jgi:hypothetical protein
MSAHRPCIAPMLMAETACVCLGGATLPPCTSLCVANSMDSFADKLWAAKETIPLPTYVGEVGDGWVNGAGSDPWRNAALRAIRRARNEMVADGRLQPTDPALQAFEFRLLVHPEHNWGLSGLGEGELEASSLLWLSWDVLKMGSYPHGYA